MSGAELIAVLGITSSVLQIADACSKILDRIQAFRQNLAFQDLVVQLPLLISVVRGLESSQHRELLDNSTKQALSRVLEGCLRQLRRLESLLKSMTPAEAASKFEKTWKGIRSFGKDTKLREILGALTEYKSTISLHLSSIHVHSSQKPNATSETTKSFFDVPSSRLPHFVGRSDVFSQIQDIVDSSTTYPVLIVLTGAGGQGKTQVALEFCHRNAATYSAIFWIDSSSETSATRSYENILKLMSEERLSDEAHDAKVEVKALLRNWQEPWLLIFDNFDSPNSFQNISTFFPQSNGSNKNTILVTSRHLSSARLGNSIPLTGLSEDEGLELLMSRSTAISKVDYTAQELIDGRDIVKKLGFLALAIDQAAAYISIRQLPLSLFIEHFELRKEYILNATSESLWEYRKRTSDGSEDSNENLSVLTTWEMSFDQISQNYKARTRIGDFLMQAAFFSPANISETLFSNFYQQADGRTLLWKLAFETNGAWDTFKFQDVVVGLVNLSLVQTLSFDSNGVSFSLHPLIKDWLQLRREIGPRQRMTATAIVMTSAFIQSFDNEKLSFRNRQDLLAHIDASTDNCAYHLTSEEALITYGGFVEGYQTTFATFYGDHDRFNDAEKLFLKALSLQEPKLGYKSIATLSTLNNLGALYLSARQLENAKPKLELALRIKETMLGADHARTLNTVNNIGNLLALQMKYDEATLMYQRTLEGYTKINGAMHNTVFESLNNLGEVAMKKGDFKEAEQFFKTAFTKARTISGGKDNSLVLYLGSNIALVYKLQRRYHEALQTYADVVAGRERLLGAEHSSTLQSMCEVADVHMILGDAKSANEWYQKGSATSERRKRGKIATIKDQQSEYEIGQSSTRLESPEMERYGRFRQQVGILTGNDELRLPKQDTFRRQVSEARAVAKSQSESLENLSVPSIGSHIDRSGASSWNDPPELPAKLPRDTGRRQQDRDGHSTRKLFRQQENDIDRGSLSMYNAGPQEDEEPSLAAGNPSPPSIDRRDVTIHQEPSYFKSLSDKTGKIEFIDRGFIGTNNPTTLSESELGQWNTKSPRSIDAQVNERLGLNATQLPFLDTGFVHRFFAEYQDEPEPSFESKPKKTIVANSPPPTDPLSRNQTRNDHEDIQRGLTARQNWQGLIDGRLIGNKQELPVDYRAPPHGVPHPASGLGSKVSETHIDRRGVVINNKIYNDDDNEMDGGTGPTGGTWLPGNSGYVGLGSLQDRQMILGDKTIIDRGFRTMSNAIPPPPVPPELWKEMARIDRSGFMFNNFDVDDMDIEHSQTKQPSRNSSDFPNIRPRSNCAYIERGGVCMHNGRHWS